MGSELFCEFRISSAGRISYWWPLIFETMHWKSFTFTAPSEPEGIGYYYYIRQGNETDTDFVKTSFRTVWDEINSETSQMLISLWHLNQGNFPIDVSIEQKELNTIVILLSLSDAYLIDLSLEEARHRLRIFLNCAKSTYDVCRPCIGKIFWEDIQPPLALLGNPSEVLPLMENQQKGERTKFLKEYLPDGSLMFILDSIPIKVRGGWRFTSLHD